MRARVRARARVRVRVRVKGEGEGEGEAEAEGQPAWSDSRGPGRRNQRPSAPCGWETGRAWSWWASVSVQSKLTRMHPPSPRRRRHSHTMGLGGSRGRPRMRLEMISSESRVGLRLTASMQAEHPLGSAPRRTGPPSTAKRGPGGRMPDSSLARWRAGSRHAWSTGHTARQYLVARTARASSAAPQRGAWTPLCWRCWRCLLV